MEFNVLMCKFMVISRKQSNYGPPRQLCTDGVGHEKVNELKYLDVWLSNSLGLSGHDSKSVQRMPRQIGMYNL